jgi:hypothetical protein
VPLKTFRVSTTPAAVRGAILLLAGTALLAACAQPVRVKGEWDDRGARGEVFQRVLVVGVSPDFDRRCEFERFMANRMRNDATVAIASCRVMARDVPLTRENFELVVKEHQVDAVLATFLVGGEIRAHEGGTLETQGDAFFKPEGVGYWGGYGYYGVYGMPVYYGQFETAPPIVNVRGEVEITSQFFRTRDATLVYTLNTRARDLESRVAGLAEVTGPIAERLRREGLVR